jgi:hypothetical protein
MLQCEGIKWTITTEPKAPGPNGKTSACKSQTTRLNVFARCKISLACLSRKFTRSVSLSVPTTQYPGLARNKLFLPNPHGASKTGRVASSFHACWRRDREGSDAANRPKRSDFVVIPVLTELRLALTCPRGSEVDDVARQAVSSRLGLGHFNDPLRPSPIVSATERQGCDPKRRSCEAEALTGGCARLPRGIDRGAPSIRAASPATFCRIFI